MSFTCLENAMNDLLDSYIDDYNKYLIPDSADIQLSLEDVDFNERAFITHLIGPASEFSFIPEQDYASLCSAIEYQDAFDKYYNNYDNPPLSRRYEINEACKEYIVKNGLEDEFAHEYANLSSDYKKGLSEKSMFATMQYVASRHAYQKIESIIENLDVDDIKPFVAVKNEEINDVFRNSELPLSDKKIINDFYDSICELDRDYNLWRDYDDCRGCHFQGKIITPSGRSFNIEFNFDSAKIFFDNLIDLIPDNKYVLADLINPEMNYQMLSSEIQCQEGVHKVMPFLKKLSKTALKFSENLNNSYHR